MRRKDLTGRRFGRLLVLCPERSTQHGMVWHCQCDCGEQRDIYASALTTGRTKSCGCYHDECSRRGTHGGSRSPEYKVWSSLIDRCHNENNRHYKNYGGRGIAVCKRWRDKFENFINDMGPRPSPSHTVERKNNSCGYSPFNCRWATRKEQQNNMRTNRLVTLKGRTQTVSQWADEVGMKHATLYSRIYHGWSAERAITEPVR